MSKFIVLHRQDDRKEVVLNTEQIRLILSANLPNRKKGDEDKIVTHIHTVGGLFYAAESYEEVKKMLMEGENNEHI